MMLHVISLSRHAKQSRRAHAPVSFSLFPFPFSHLGPAAQQRACADPPFPADLPQLCSGPRHEQVCVAIAGCCLMCATRLPLEPRKHPSEGGASTSLPAPA